MSDDTLRTIIYVMVLTLAPINIYVTYKLLGLSHSYGGRVGALSERATVSGLLLIGTLAGSAFAFGRLSGLNVSPVINVLLNGIAAFMLAVPAVYWYLKYRSGGFGEDNDG